MGLSVSVANALVALALLACVSQRWPFDEDLHETHAALDQPAGHQAAPAVAVGLGCRSIRTARASPAFPAPDRALRWPRAASGPPARNWRCGPRAAGRSLMRRAMFVVEVCQQLGPQAGHLGRDCVPGARYSTGVPVCRKWTP